MGGIERGERNLSLVNIEKIALAWIIHDFAGEKRKGALKD